MLNGSNPENDCLLGGIRAHGKLKAWRSLEVGVDVTIKQTATRQLQ